MWEEVIEAACRAGHTEWALQVLLLHLPSLPLDTFHAQGLGPLNGLLVQCCNPSCSLKSIMDCTAGQIR